jgi:hypothetical protein
MSDGAAGGGDVGVEGAAAEDVGKTLRATTGTRGCDPLGMRPPAN